MTLTGAKLIASPTSVRLIQSFGMDRARCIPLIGGETVRLRGATVRSFAVQHDRLFGRVPFDGPPRRLPPRSVSDWVCGEPLAFLIEMGGRRLYIESGGRPNGSPCQGIGPVDLAILGVALPDARKRFPLTLQRLRPRYVLPSHQDDFFRPLSRGFTFGAGSDFPSVLRAFRAAPKSIVADPPRLLPAVDAPVSRFRFESVCIAPAVAFSVHYAGATFPTDMSKHLDKDESTRCLRRS